MKKNILANVAVAACLTLASGAVPALSAWDDAEDTRIYKVVINHEEQYSIWPADRENPLGWNDVGKSGTKQECLSYIEEVWTDMRPLSLRKKMEEMERQRQNSRVAAKSSQALPKNSRQVAQMKTQDGVFVLKISGKITIGTGDVALRNAVQEALSSGAKKILLNLEAVTKIDSSGIGELVSSYTTANNRGCQLALCCLPTNVQKILTLTQLTSVFDIYPSEAEAIAASKK